MDTPFYSDLNDNDLSELEYTYMYIYPVDYLANYMAVALKYSTYSYICSYI